MLDDTRRHHQERTTGNGLVHVSDSGWRRLEPRGHIVDLEAYVRFRLLQPTDSAPRYGVDHCFLQSGILLNARGR